MARTTDWIGLIRRNNFIPQLRERFSYVSLYSHIVLGNSVIIVIGAVGGTLITRALSGRAASFWLIAFFAAAGITMSILLNNWIVRRQLKPLNEIHALVDRLAAGQTAIDTRGFEKIGPDFNRLSAALDAIIRQLEERNQQLKALSERAIKVQEEERMRIARSLHDDTGQSLSSLIMILDRLENRLPADTAELQQRLAAARSLASSALEELRRIIFDLRPTILDDLGLVPAIRWYARKYLEPEGVQVKIFTAEEEIKLPEELATTLFRISQEAINNIIRHASAKVVMIILAVGSSEVLLQLIDDGLGFDGSRMTGQGPHPKKLGLLGIMERVELVGGKVSLHTAPGQGVRLDVRIPLAKGVKLSDEKNPDPAC